MWDQVGDIFPDWTEGVYRPCLNINYVLLVFNQTAVKRQYKAYGAVVPSRQTVSTSSTNFLVGLVY